MSQEFITSWTNASPAAVRNQSVGFTVGEITVTDRTNGAQYYWNSSMPSGSYILVSSGAYTGTNGFTPLSQGGYFGAPISGFTNANPGVITAAGVAQVGIVAGDTIEVANLADDASGTSLNGSYVVASVTATTITTATNTSSYSAYVSGGVAVRKLDSDGKPVPTENFAIEGITLGSGVVGGSSANMSLVATGSNPVV